MYFWKWFPKVLLVLLVSDVTSQNPMETCVVRHGFANCSNIGLIHIPLDLPQTIVDIDASHNRVSFFQWPLPYFHLLKLNLSRNNIEYISSYVFLQLFSLDTIDLSFNNIRYLSNLDSNYTFLNTPQLVNLILRGNPLKSLGTHPIRSYSLRKLDVSECDIRSLEGETSLLHMRSLVALSLDRNPLTKVEYLVSDSLEELYLAETQLRYIKPEFYTSLPKLKVLDLSNNLHLTSLSRIGRASSSTLMILKAEFCSLEYLQIHSLPRLERLYLRGNKIAKIVRGDFSFNGKLFEVDLSMNWIHQVDPMGFAGAINLANMDLSGNKIFELGNSLSSLSHLVTLNVSSNPLFTIDGVESAALLSVLDVSHCQLSSLPISFFSLENIESVNLSRNVIWTLPPGMTSYTLLELNLGYNRLSEIDDDWFRHFPRLRSLDLIGNRLTEPFHLDTLKRLEHVKLHLEDNPWRCNCGEEQYRNFYMHLSTKGSLHSLHCHGPSNVSGLTWHSACYIVEASTQKNTKKNAWLPMLVTALTTLGIIFLLYLLRRRTVNIEEELRESHREVSTVPGTSHVLPGQEACLPSYEEALLMPKPKGTTKTSVDTQTQASYLGSVRSLDSRAKHALVHSPSSNSL